MFKEINQTEKGILVSPGEKLGVIEEFIPGKGTYIDNGTIYASITGLIFFDKSKRELHITPVTHQPVIPKVENIVIGEVISLQEKMLTVKIIQIENHPLSDPFIGIMHISDVSQGYVKVMNDAYKVGDIIRAKVISTQNREFHLSTRDNQLGVIQASCVYCGGPLIRQKNNLRCSKCSRIDRRKITLDYGKDN